jgi:hypothetical protein
VYSLAATVICRYLLCWPVKSSLRRLYGTCKSITVCTEAREHPVHASTSQVSSARSDIISPSTPRIVALSPLLTVFAGLVQQTLRALNAAVADGRQTPLTNHKVQPIKSDLELSLPDPEFSNYGRAWGVKPLPMLHMKREVNCAHSYSGVRNLPIDVLSFGFSRFVIHAKELTNIAITQRPPL